MRDYREYFEKVKKDYKVSVKSKKVTRISLSLMNFREVLIIESF